MKILKFFFIYFVTLFFLTGCFDKIELEERGLVLAIGIDKYNSKNYNENEKLLEEKRFTVSMVMPEVSEGEKQGDTEKQNDPMNKDKTEKSVNKDLKKGSGASLASTMDLIDKYMSKNLYYGHTKVVVFGKQILENENLLKEAIDSLERNNEISRKVIILGTDERAEDILQIVPKDEKMIGIYINDFYKNNKRNSPFTFRVDLEDIIKKLLSTGDCLIPNIKIVDSDIRLGGLLVIKDYKLVKFLDDNLTKGILWIIDKRSLGEIAIPFEDGYVPINIYKKKINSSFYEKNEKIVYKFDMKLEGNISEYTIGKNIMIDTEKYKMLEKELSNYINDNIKGSLEVIKDLNADIIEIKEMIRKNNYELYNKYNLEKNNIYDYLEFDINSTIKIKGAGSIK